MSLKEMWSRTGASVVYIMNCWPPDRLNSTPFLQFSGTSYNHYSCSKIIQGGLEVHKNLRGDTARTAGQNDLRDIAYYMTSCLSIKLGWWRRKRGMFRVTAFIFPTNCYVWWALLSWKWLNVCLLMGSNELILCFALFVWVAFALPSELSLSQPLSSHTFYLSDSFLHLTWEVCKQLCGT